MVDEAWIDERVAEANRLYAVVPLRFRAAHVAELPARFARLASRASRDAVIGRIVPGAVNVRVTGELLDVDEPGVRRGVHWHDRRDRSRHVVILSKIGAPSVLAHELGHFFGNPHSFVDDNLMSYLRTGAPLFLDEHQLSVIRYTLRAYLASRELSALRAD
ncbi:MAG: hypothetical protein ABI321_18650 [Polyangia bacterium]